MTVVAKQRAATALAFIAVAFATLEIVHRAPELSLAGGSAAVEVSAAATAVVAAIAIWREGFAFPALLAASTGAWLVAEWNSPGAGVAFTPGLLLYAAWPALLAAAALRGLDDRKLDRPAVALIAAALATSVGVLGLASAFVYDPGAESCSECPSNLVAFADAPRAGRAIGHVGLALSVLWIGAFVALAVISLLRSSHARRPLAALVLIPSSVAIALFAVDAVHGYSRSFTSNDKFDRSLRLLEACALVFVAAGIGVARLRTLRKRRVLAQIVLDVGAAPAPGELRARLAESLGDPSLDLLYRLDGGEWVDSDGRRASIPLDGAGGATRLRSGGEEVLAVLHRPGLLDDPALVRELATTTSLALEHERLHASRRARLEELRASCARIVAASDDTRRELERDLHDGAQQRLVALALTIRLARHQIAGADQVLVERLAAAEDQVRAAVVELREVAHGLFPAVLAEEGLRIALGALAEQSPRLVPGAVPDGRFPAPVEFAGYFAALEALRLTEDDVTVDGVAENGSLQLVIGTDGRLAGATTAIWDRVNAVGGTITAAYGELRLEMPCVS